MQLVAVVLHSGDAALPSFHLEALEVEAPEEEEDEEKEEEEEVDDVHCHLK